MMNEDPFEQVNEGASTSQAGRGEKRTHEGVGDDDDDDDEDERPYVIENVKEVNIKKFQTKGTNYSLRFNNIMADVEIKDVHERLHEVFQHILSDTVGDVPSRDQVHNGNCTEWSAIWSEIKRVITKSHDREAGVRFVITSLISDQNCTTRSAISTLLHSF